MFCKYGFWSINQWKGIIDNFVTELNTKAKTVILENKEDKWLEARIIFGINDDHLREWLREYRVLQQTMEMYKAVEASKKQLEEIQSDKKVGMIKKQSAANTPVQKAIPETLSHFYSLLYSM